MNATDEVKPTFLSASEIVTRAMAGSIGLACWTIDAAYPPEDAKQSHPRIRRCYIYYTLDTGKWCSISYQNAKARAVLELLDTGALKDQAVEWATAYDDSPRSEEEKPFGIGPVGKEKLMCYRGRLWDIPAPVSLNAGENPYDADNEGIDGAIEAFSCNDCGSCCYYEKKDGIFEMVIG